MNVYEVIGITLDERKQPKNLIFGPVIVVAAHEQAAILQATLENNIILNEYNPSEVAIRVRPF